MILSLLSIEVVDVVSFWWCVARCGPEKKKGVSTIGNEVRSSAITYKPEHRNILSNY